MGKLTTLTKIFQEEFHLYPQVGLEVEFYLRPLRLPSEEAMYAFLSDCQAQGINIIAERGINQFELTITHGAPAAVVDICADNIKQLQHLVQRHNLEIDFSPKPHADDYGSALHLHLSLHDSRNNHNVFAGSKMYSENQWLMRSIAGLMYKVPAYLQQFCQAGDYQRFQHEFMAPSHFAWGGNNRTTIIRIPDAEASARRFEFRLPSASAAVQDVLIFMLESVLYGLRQQLQAPPRIYGNAFDPQYKLVRLPQCPEELAAFTAEIKGLHHTKTQA